MRISDWSSDVCSSDLAIMSRGGAVKQSPPTTGRLHEAFGHLFRRCHLRSQQAFARVFDGYGLSPLQYGLLELVLLNPGIGHGALTEALATAPSVVTTAMKPLRAAGPVVRSEGRRVGKECVRLCRSRWSPCH